jgi:hypothetical protein
MQVTYLSASLALMWLVRQHSVRSVCSKKFWRWYITLRVTGFLDFVHRVVFYVSATISVSVLRLEETPTLFGPWERANINHWNVVFFRVFFGIPHDGQCPKTQRSWSSYSWNVLLFLLLPCWDTDFLQSLHKYSMTVSVFNRRFWLSVIVKYGNRDGTGTTRWSHNTPIITTTTWAVILLAGDALLGCQGTPDWNPHTRSRDGSFRGQHRAAIDPDPGLGLRPFHSRTVYTTSGATLPLLPVGNTYIFVTLIHTLPPRPMENTIVLVTLFCTQQKFTTLMLIPVQYPNHSVSAITLISLPKKNTPGEVLVPFPVKFHFRYNITTTWSCTSN